MNAVKIYENAKWKLEHNEITLGEFETEIKPLKNVTEVKRGEWIDKGSLSCRCSNCGCKSSKESNFCSVCGADMREEEKR